ncbi:helix-turn-helix domain-containing protein [Lederbergia wuyishanensis]|uniref:YesN/AraC family two-component response regulator n=1 Tax=Lederbergia wuyishanensis TaxID=1347903 RepID=A0ABU0D9M8_9BACI|nr:AraC family transcriptional regulator [Lederbergia wuyishanensis]MCJ8007435.1 AraC family transcriptional regulator [Lederbergia wuyishanensis]MDQ0345127.1 YesN/AraC family two-component response regulator [Lederbergia wuyishanensis]
MLQFSAPPLPIFLAAGEDTYTIGQTHPNRNNIGVFDLLVVTRGCLIMGENGEKYPVEEKQALILYPDRHHYSFTPCESETHFYWIHFVMSKEWIDITEDSSRRGYDFTKSEHRNAFSEQSFWIRLPKHGKIQNWSAVDVLCRQLLLIEENTTYSWEWKRQMQFQQLLQELANKNHWAKSSPALAVAEQAASFLRKNFAKKINYKELGESLSYHPNYIARCMINTLGYSPVDYINQVRCDHAKILLVSTNWSIEKIAENCGFQQTAYFSRFFKKKEGMSPNQFRKQYEGH